MPPSHEIDVWREFTRKPPKPGQKLDVFECRHCNWKTSKNASRNKTHLLKCNQYLKYMRNSGRDNTITALAISPSIAQPIISLQKMTLARREHLDHKAAMAIYIGAHAFRAFEEEHMSDFLVDLSANTWKPPTRHRLARELLNSCYKKVESKVNIYLKP